MYLNPSEYSGDIPAEQLESRIRRACRDIDSLTYNRIVKAGFENLTEFQQGLIKEAVQLHMDFCFDNAELLDSPLAAYSINGVSMSFDKSKIVTVGSVTTSSEVYSLLMQTGLCYRGLI
ncbi:MAG: hypothetical protein K6G33_12575 [Ruminococcus sp.]|uniref:hypothetical protein n=1 Tax=Ruminococcus sp. TaxID=41978 RepID=UPI0025EEA2CD|nr:hypothetical protein [Ruminococcus sp.]MCR5601564.1 hypothetical protein [Ruminococcus sp.]